MWQNSWRSVRNPWKNSERIQSDSSIGLGKKVLLANNLGALHTAIIALPDSQVSMVTYWIGMIAYTLQIYFDFSGYSDMAIGLGRMFGFEFMENFNYPYISKTITEFWRDGIFP
jgi:alginate O-acetyltransferase complex protein AlgI